MAVQAEKVVSDFCGAWSKLNVEEIMSFFTDDALYHNIPMKPARNITSQARPQAREPPYRLYP